jgi:hypothetical protein
MNNNESIGDILMRLYIRNKLVELLPTIMDGVKYIVESDIKNAQTVGEDCLWALQSIRETLQKSLSEQRFQYYNEMVLYLEESIKEMMSKDTNELEESVQIIIDRLINSLQEESEVKAEILFLPYKSSMWDSLESIWLAAKDDPRCNCYVMPIPYYDRDSSGRLAEFHYEGHQLPNDVPITSYLDYNISERRPDVIYFHNPYDGNNFITSVAPEYYSDKLKQYTDMLVYVPYFIAGAYPNAEKAASKCLANGVLNASRVIVQSEILKEVYVKNGLNPSKVVVLGSPKIDAILKPDENIDLPEEWKLKMYGKKVILLNSSIGKLLSDSNYLLDLEKNIKTIMNNKEVVLLWRPHPLFEATLKSMRLDYLDAFIELKNYVKRSKNGILDESVDPSYAITASDSMVSDNSSLIRTYIMSGKPILVMESSKNKKQHVMLSCDTFSCYFYNDGFTVEKFLEIVNNNLDFMRQKRLTDFQRSIVNTDGSSGLKIHSYILNQEF